MKRPSRSTLLLLFSIPLLLGLTGPESRFAPPPLTVTGSGSAFISGDFDFNGHSNGKPAFQHLTFTNVEIAWSGSRWELFNTFESKIYYTNTLEFGDWVPREGWTDTDGVGIAPFPTLSGSATRGPLAGTYTVGGGSPDFATISAAVDALNENGITNDVTFSIRPGTYDEQVEIEYFESYGSSTDSVLVTPESGTVDWNYTGAGVTNNYFVSVDSAKNITIDGIDFDDPGGAITYATIVSFGNADNLLIRNCNFDGVLNATTITQSLINYTTVVNSDVDIVDNTFVHGYYGVRGATVTNVARNSFQKQDKGAILITSSTGAKILDNTITDWASSAATYTGIDVTGTLALIARNLLELIKGDTGIRQDGTVSKVQNNMVAMLDASIAAGIDVDNDGNPAVHFNTVWIGSSPTGTALLLSPGTGPSSVFNNLLINEGGGITLQRITGDFTSNFNNLYSTGVLLVSAGASDYANLVDWQASSGSPDPNSVSKAVSFVSTVSTVDLHLTGASDGDTDLIGIPIGGVTTDIDGDTRSPTVPYMGADEASTSLLPLHTLRLFVLLEGPFAGSSLTPTLNSSGHMAANATTHPYGVAPWNYGGSESVSAGFFAANPSVVDWVYLKLYSGTVPNVTVVDSTVGFVLSGGAVVSHTDTTLHVQFHATAGSYHVGVFHRNHLAVISRVRVNFTVPPVTQTYNFTNSQTKAYTTGPNPMKFISTGFYGLYAADSNTDGQVTASDFNEWLVDTKAVATGYLPSDFNMDGQVTASDFNVWLVNTKAVAASQVP